MAALLTDDEVFGRSAPDSINTQPRGIRTNNPGNIRNINGQGFQQFSTPEDGIAATAKNLVAYNDKHGLNTISGIINRWAPPNENNTGAYIQAVSQDLNVDPNQPLDVKNPQILAALTSAITKHENGKNPYSPEQIQGGVGRVIPAGYAPANDQKSLMSDEDVFGAAQPDQQKIKASIEAQPISGGDKVSSLDLNDLIIGGKPANDISGGINAAMEQQIKQDNQGKPFVQNFAEGTNIGARKLGTGILQTLPAPVQEWIAKQSGNTRDQLLQALAENANQERVYGTGTGVAGELGELSGDARNWVAPELKGAAAGAKLISRLPQAAKFAGMGAAYGGLNSVESADADEIAKQKLKNATIGAAVGGAVPYAPEIIQGAGKAAGAVGKYIGDETVGNATNLAKGTVSMVKGSKPMQAMSDAINSSATAAYKDMRNKGAVFTPQAGSDIASTVDNGLKNSGLLNQSLHGDTLGVVNDLKTYLENPNATLEGLDQHRQLLSQVIKKNTSKIDGANPDAQKATAAIKAIDNAVENLSAKDIASGDPSAVQSLLEGRFQYAKARRFDRVNDMLQDAGGNMEKFKTQLQNFVKDDRNLRGFSTEEKKSLQNAANYSNGESLLSMFGRLGVDFSRTTSGKAIPALEIAGGALAGHSALPAIAFGTLAKYGQKAITHGKINNALSMISKRQGP